MKQTARGWLQKNCKTRLACSLETLTLLHVGPVAPTAIQHRDLIFGPAKISGCACPEVAKAHVQFAMSSVASTTSSVSSDKLFFQDVEHDFYQCISCFQKKMKSQHAYVLRTPNKTRTCGLTRLPSLARTWKATWLQKIHFRPESCMHVTGVPLLPHQTD